MGHGLGARMRAWQRAMVVIAGVLGLALGGGPLAVAQDATPAASGPTADGLFAANIRSGTCDRLGAIAYPLANVAYGFQLLSGLPARATPGPERPEDAAVVGSAAATAAATSVTTIPATIAELVGGAHAVDVSCLPGAPAASVACGAIGGVRIGADLVFGLQERNASDYTGTAWLHENNDGTTTVSLFLAPRLAGEGSDAAPTAALGETDPAPLPTAAANVPPESDVRAIAIVDGRFGVAELSLQQGEPTVLHVVNGDDRAYRLRIRDLVTVTPIAPRAATTVEFTTPVVARYEGELLAADTDTVLDTVPVVVLGPGGIRP